MFRDGQRSPSSHQVVTGIMRKTAGLAQSTGGTHTDERQRWREEGQEKKRDKERVEGQKVRRWKREKERSERVIPVTELTP